MIRDKNNESMNVMISEDPDSKAEGSFVEETKDNAIKKSKLNIALSFKSNGKMVPRDLTPTTITII